MLLFSAGISTSQQSLVRPVLFEGVSFDNNDLNTSLSGTPLQFPFSYACQQLCNVTEDQVDLRILFGLGDDIRFDPNIQTFNSTLTIEVFKEECDGSYVFAEEFTLSISEENPEQLAVMDITLPFQDLEGVSIEVQSYTPPVGYEDNVELSISYDRDIIVDVTTESPDHVSVNELINGSGRYRFTWSTRCSFFMNYEFQLLRLYNVDLNKETPQDISAKIDWSTATTIITDSWNQTLDLTVTEGTGYYVWRVRGIGNGFSGGYGNSDNWGEWSQPGYADGTLVDVDADDLPNLFFYQQFDENKNWIHNRVFIEGERNPHEETKIGEGITYANGLSQVQQTQARVSSQEAVLVSETVYDYSGRPTLQAMSVPLNNRDYLGYEPNMLRTSLSTPYSAADFDTDDNYFSPKPARITNTQYEYYSDNNPDPTIPSASKPNATYLTSGGTTTLNANRGYPFSRALYYGDGSGRLKEQSGVGYDHMIGAGAKTTTMKYSSVADDELIRVFGHEAQSGSTVHKVFSTDPNGVTSVSYINTMGQTLLNALVASGVNPIDGSGNLDGLATQDIATFRVHEDINPATVFANDQYIERKKDLVLFTATSLDIYYEITPAFVEANCLLNQCNTCDYEVEVFVRDVNTGVIQGSVYTATITPQQICSSGAPYTISYTVPNVPAGSYDVIQRLYYNTVDPGSTTNQTYLDTEIQAIYTALSNVVYTNILGSVATAMDDIENGTGTLSQLYSAITTEFGIQFTGYEDGDMISLDMNLGNGTTCFTIDIPYYDCYDPNDAANCPTSTTAYQDYYDDAVYNNPDIPAFFKSAIPKYYPPLEINPVTGNLDEPAIPYNMPIDDLIALMVTSGNAYTPYNCMDLWNCWRFVCDNYEDLLTNSLNQGNNFYIINEFLNCTGYRYVGIDNNLYLTHPFAYIPYVMEANDDDQADSYSSLQCEQAFGVSSGGTICSSSTATCAQIAGMQLPPNQTVATLQIQSFYNCVISSQPGVSPDDIITAGQNAIGGCEEGCELRAVSFREELIYQLRDANMVIEGDEYAYDKVPLSGTGVSGVPPQYVFVEDLSSPITPGTYDVSLSTIECTVNALVANCKEGCTLTPQYDGNGNLIGLGSQAESDLVANILAGNYELSLPVSGACSSSSATLVDPAAISLSTEPNPIDNTTLVSWNKTMSTSAISGGNSNMVMDILKVSGAGYLMASDHYRVGSQTEVVLQKIDGDGDLVWEKGPYGSSSDLDRVSALVELGGYYYMIGSTQSEADAQSLGRQSDKAGGAGNFDYWVVKLDQVGNVIFDKTFGGMGDDYALNAVVKDGNLLIFGASNSDESGNKLIPGNGGYDAWVVEMSPAGLVLGQYAYGRGGDDYFIDAVTDDQDNVYFAGATNSVADPDYPGVNATPAGGRGEEAEGGTDAWVLKVDDQFAWQWDRATGGSGDDYFSSIKINADDDLLVAGYSNSIISGEKQSDNYGGNDYFLAEVDASTGVVNWDRSYGSVVDEGPHSDANNILSEFEEKQVELLVLNSGNLMLGGSAQNAIGNLIPGNRDDEGDGVVSYWVVMTDENGTHLGDRSVGGNLYDDFGGFVQSFSGGIVVAGSSNSAASAEKSDASVLFNTWVLELGEQCSGMEVCFEWTGPFTAPTIPSDVELNEPISCADQVVAEFQSAIALQVSEAAAEISSNYRNDYFAICTDPDVIEDQFSISYELSYHHYTLFYYDRAGRLIKTVPPAGVDLADVDQGTGGADWAKLTTDFARDFVPKHRFITDYYYNSLGQLERQNTPDGGETFFYYDDISRLRFSQNAKQLSEGTYSYIKYDELGRVIESGESSQDATGQGFMANVNNVSTYPDDVNFQNEVVRSVYSDPYSGLTYRGEEQSHLRNRISYMIKDSDPGVTGDESYIFYSYDPHGNVKWMVQQNEEVGQRGVAYDYDLISGNVIQVSYNEGQLDQFFHRYTYDTDNRLLTAETSVDGVIWDVDADYDYYKHGPLKRITLGEDNIQGKDYTYTINGWLKAMNHSSEDLFKDPGADGAQNTVAQDVFGMVLNYFDGDFTKNNSQFNNNNNSPAANEEDYLKAKNNTVNTANKDNLYNGNISSWSWRQQGVDINNQSDPYFGKTVGYQYRYDELNRIKSADFSYINASNAWNPTLNYHTAYQFDASGNLTNLVRNTFDPNNDPAVNVAMDDIDYRYDAGLNGGDYQASAINLPVEQFSKNRLNFIYDYAGTVSMAGDIGDQSSYASSGNYNYQYDEIGQLIKDQSEDIESIEWNPSHKVTKIIKTAAAGGEVISFTYDAMGNRIGKSVEHPSDREQSYKLTYSLDAQGNVMAIYKTTYKIDNAGTGDYTAYVHLIEQPIYGSDRLGMRIGEDILIRQTQYVDGVATEVTVDNRIYITENEINAVGLQGKETIKGGKLFGFSYSHQVFGQLRIAPSLATADQAFMASGNAGSNQFVYEDEAGNPVLYISTSSSGNGGHLKLEDPNGNLVQSQYGLIGHYQKKTLALRLSDDILIIISQNAQNHVYWHEVRLNAGPNGEPVVTTNYNNLITTNGLNAMALVEDHEGTVGHKLFILEKNGSTSSAIRTYRISLDPNDQPQVNLDQAQIALNGVYGEGSLQISPDGKRLALVGTSIAIWPGNSPFFPVPLALPKIVGTVYRLDEDYNIAGTINSFIELFSTTQSADFTPSGDYIYYNYESNNGNYLKRFDISTSAISVVMSGKKSVRRAKDGTMLVVNGSNTTNGGYTVSTITSPDSQTPVLGTYPLPTALHSQQVIRPHFALQVHRIYPPEENIFTRNVEHKYYEIKDHLGNVRSVVSDIKYGDPLTYAETWDYQELDLEFDNGYTPDNATGWYQQTTSCFTGLPLYVSGGQLIMDYPPVNKLAGCQFNSVDFFFRVTPGEVYTVEFEGDRLVNTSDQFFLEYRDGNGAKFDPVGNIDPGQAHFTYTHTFTAPTNVVRIKFFGIGTPASTNTTMALDYLRIYSQGDILADVVSYSDYYPYGMMMPGRHGETSSSSYRYGYNAMERDDEVKGAGNSYTTEFRQLDPRLGRWLTMDPMGYTQPGNSPYNSMRNSPISRTDPMGNTDDWYMDENGEAVYDEDVHSQEDLDAKGIEGSYLGAEGVGVPRGGREVSHLMKDGSYKPLNMNLPGLEVTATDVSKVGEQAVKPVPNLMDMLSAGASIIGPVHINPPTIASGRNNPGSMVTSVGISGTVSISTGISGEIGFIRKGDFIYPYATGGGAWGVDMSVGINGKLHVSNDGSELSPQDLSGWGEEYEGSVWIIDGTYGGGSYHSTTNSPWTDAFNPNHFSNKTSGYTSVGTGVSLSPSPIGATKQKGYTWVGDMPIYFPTMDGPYLK